MTVTNFNNYVVNNFLRRFFNHCDISRIFISGEKELLKCINHFEPSPIFVVGLPRSGTTLLYQLLVNSYNFSYFSVFNTFFPSSPLTAYKFQRKMFKGANNFGYSNYYGKIESRSLITNLLAPAEGHQIFANWFPECDHHEYTKKFNTSRKQSIHRTVAGYEEISGLPFLNKNPRNSLRVLPLADAFPKALFIVVDREPVFIAQSLYIARLKSMEESNKIHINWWGTRPSDYYNFIHLDPLRQSAFQTISILNKLNENIRQINNVVHRVNYRKLCEDPKKVFNELIGVLHNAGVTLVKKDNIAIPMFRCNDVVKIKKCKFDFLEKELNDNLDG